jgi:hypothetical protein
MRRPMAQVLIAVMASSGCARSAPMGVQMPTGEAAEHVHDWSVLARLAPGTHVLVEQDSARLVDAKVEAISDSGLAVRRQDRDEMLARASVVRVVRVESISGIRAKQGARGGLLVGGLVLFLTGGALWIPVVIDPPAFAALGALTGAGKERQSLVYERR